MLRAGLTGGLGSGKTTAAQIFSACGATIISADEVGRALMQPGQDVYQRIVALFGPDVVQSDGFLNRGAIAGIVFTDPAALDRLNRIVHPAVVAEEERQADVLFAGHPHAVAIIESALIFEVERDGTAPGWSRRFDKLILVTAPDELKIARYIARIEADRGSPLSPAQRLAAIADARQRMAAQMTDDEKAAHCDYVIENTGTREQLEAGVRRIYQELAVQA
jgi:dephospho-CoA kinase